MQTAFRRWEIEPECSDPLLAAIQRRIDALNKDWFAGLIAPQGSHTKSIGARAGEEITRLERQRDAYNQTKKKKKYGSVKITVSEIIEAKRSFAVKSNVGDL